MRKPFVNWLPRRERRKWLRQRRPPPPLPDDAGRCSGVVCTQASTWRSLFGSSSRRSPDSVSRGARADLLWPRTSSPIVRFETFTVTKTVQW
ncbi:hypothetical protein MRX96_044701 [Rhipicephalus microplus]